VCRSWLNTGVDESWLNTGGRAEEKSNMGTIHTGTCRK
jgi:hypothetical protein